MTNLRVLTFIGVLANLTHRFSARGRDDDADDQPTVDSVPWESRRSDRWHRATSILALLFVACHVVNSPSTLAFQPSSDQSVTGQGSDAETTQESESDTQPTPQSPVDQDEKGGYDDRFMALIRQRQANEERISWLLANMPIGFVDRQQKFRDEIQQLKTKNLELDRMIQDVAADALLKSDIELKPTMAQYLVRLAEKKMSGKDPAIPFDPVGARRMIRALILRMPKERSLPLLAYRADYLAQDFEGALKWLERAKLLGATVPPKLEADTRQMIEWWNRELAIRAEETEADDLPRVKLDTDVGSITLELFENQAPNTVANFVALVEQGFYDNQIFYRVTPAMIVQTGCPDGDGRGGPGYAIASEAGRPDARHFFSGTVGMYQDEQGNAGSQFFIVKQPAPFLNGRFTAFGRVIEGMDTVHKIQVIDATVRNRDSDILPTTIRSARVIRKREHDYRPTKLGDSNENDGSSQDDGQR